MTDLSNENMIHIKDGDVEYLQFKKLLEYRDEVVHCYTLKGKNNDYEENNGINYKNLSNSLGIDENDVKRIGHQAHSDKVEIVNSKEENYTEIDGLLTNKENIYLSLRFADCTPILLFDPKEKVVGNIHSGWRGTVQKIGQKGALKMIKTYNINPNNLLCFIGPCISKCHFEVGEDVKEIFENTFSNLLNKEQFIEKVEQKQNKYLIDTNIINRKLLEEIGIPKNNIIESKICTVCNSHKMHSYRAEKEKAGRNTAIIGLK